MQQGERVTRRTRYLRLMELTSRAISLGSSNFQSSAQKFIPSFWNAQTQLSSAQRLPTSCASHYEYRHTIVSCNSKMSGSPVIIVTGASKGLGLATVKILLSYKARVLGVGRSSPSAITQLQSLLSSNPDLFKYISLDVTDVDAAKKTVQSAIDHFGRLDSIVHNAGVLEPLQRIADADLNEWRRCMDVNLYAGIQLIQMGLPHLRKAKGRFILVSSGAATGPKEGWVPYCVAKAASNMLVAGLGLEEKEVVSIALRPGRIGGQTELSLY